MFSKGLKDPGLEESSIFNFGEEVQMFRKAIRESHMLDHPYESPRLASIEGDFLNPDLINFYFTACENYEAYIPS